jgi:O-antigen ligase
VKGEGGQSALPLVTDLGNIGGGIGGGTTNGSESDVSWRIAFWTHDLKAMLSDPVFGVGFGKPSAFRWHGIIYDGRTGHGTFDVIAPHNSFVNLVYRTGLLGLLALFALAAVAVRRVVRVLRSGALRTSEQALLVGCAAVFVFAAVIASFNEALEAPYLAFFFWIFLGILLILPGLFSPDRVRPQVTAGRDFGGLRSPAGPPRSRH